MTASYTDNFNLKKPAQTDNYDIEDANGNMDLIDSVLKEHSTQLKDLANPSILINGDFRNPVNQRKTESISSTGTSVEGYFIDRWLCLVNGQGNSVVKNEGFISLIGKKGTSCSQFRQFVEFPKMYRGKNVAISFKYRVSKGSDKNNVRIYSNVKGIDNPWIFNDTLIPDGEWHIYNKILSIPNSDSITGFAPIWISCINIDFNTLQKSPLTEDCQIDVEWVKSEIGSKATPFIPRPYGEELALCQRYYEVIDRVFRTTGFTLGDGMFAIEYPFLVEKRVPPTVALPSDKTGLIEVVGSRNSTPANLESFTTIGGVRFTGTVADDPNRIVGLNFRAYADAEIY